MHTGAIGHTSFNKHKSSFYSSSFYSWQLLGPHEQCGRSVPLTQTLDPAPPQVLTTACQHPHCMGLHG